MEKQNKNRIRIEIAGTRFTVLSVENEEYTYKVADRVNSEISAVRRAAPGLTLPSAVMLAALNICDNMTKAEEDADMLRLQIKEYLNEAAKYRSAYEEAERENEKLKKDMETYRKRLGEKAKTSSDPAPLSHSVKAVRKKSSSDEEADDNLSFFDNRGKV